VHLRLKFPGIFLLPLILLPATSVRAARWYEDYEMALSRIETGQCSTEAIEALGAAVVDKPKPQLNKKTYAQRRIDYLPYLMLARANLLCGNLELSTQYLLKSTAQGVAPADELKITKAEIARRKQASIPTPSPTPAVDLKAVARRYEKATQTLDRAEIALKNLDTDLAAASGVLDFIPDTWHSQRESARTEIQTLKVDITTSRKHNDLLALADSASKATSLTLEIQALQQEVKNRIRIQKAETMAAATPPTPTPRPVISQPEPKASPTPEAGPQIPDSLYRGAVAFFSGDYSSCVKHLESIDGKEARVRAGAFLLRGAGRFNLARIAGKEDGGRLLILAQDDFAQVKLLAPGMKPDPALFPPELLALFEKTQAADG